VRANGKPTVGSGANASMVGTTARSDGKPQVTYNGHPLYLYSGDQRPGDTTGEGVTAFGASWFAVSPAGDQVSGQASSSGGGGVGY
jgi:predicted lipoprotein with Yx(FWY)xxD motif